MDDCSGEILKRDSILPLTYFQSTRVFSFFSFGPGFLLLISAKTQLDSAKTTNTDVTFFFPKVSVLERKLNKAKIALTKAVLMFL